jgi:hypothetical protein
MTIPGKCSTSPDWLLKHFWTSEGGPYWAPKRLKWRTLPISSFNPRKKFGRAPTNTAGPDPAEGCARAEGSSAGANSRPWRTARRRGASRNSDSPGPRAAEGHVHQHPDLGATPSRPVKRYTSQVGTLRVTLSCRFVVTAAKESPKALRVTRSSHVARNITPQRLHFPSVSA